MSITNPHPFPPFLKKNKDFRVMQQVYYYTFILQKVPQDKHPSCRTIVVLSKLYYDIHIHIHILNLFFFNWWEIDSFSQLQFNMHKREAETSSATTKSIMKSSLLFQILKLSHDTVKSCAAAPARKKMQWSVWIHNVLHAYKLFTIFCNAKGIQKNCSTFGAAIGYSSGKNNSNLKTPPANY